MQNHHLVVPFHELTPVKSKGTSKTASLHDNLVVEGDNLKALKALLPTYHGKVKCIYIDPPYNTGNEGWAYNDAVNSPMMQDWLGKTVDREDLTRHDKWCCMMLPRLKLLREFLTDDGATSSPSTTTRSTASAASWTRCSGRRILSGKSRGGTLRTTTRR